MVQHIRTYRTIDNSTYLYLKYNKNSFANGVTLTNIAQKESETEESEEYYQQKMLTTSKKPALDIYTRK